MGRTLGRREPLQLDGVRMNNITANLFAIVAQLYVSENMDPWEDAGDGSMLEQESIFLSEYILAREEEQ